MLPAVRPVADGDDQTGVSGEPGLSAPEREIVVDNLGLVHHIVTRVLHRFPAGYGRDDLVQVGTMGLIEAARRFDPERGSRFSSFAGRRIEGAITDYLRANDWAPRSVRSRHRLVALAEGQGAVSDDEVGRLVGIEPDTVRRARADIQRARLESFERWVDDGVDVGGEATIEADILHRETLQELRSALDGLAPRQRLLVEAHFLDGQTLTDIGRAMGITQSRASQLKAEALAELRRRLSSGVG